MKLELTLRYVFIFFYISGALIAMGHAIHPVNAATREAKAKAHAQLG